MSEFCLEFCMFLFKSSCRHEKISADVKAGYCPDCGEYVENHWFITKCPCCGRKHKTIIKNGKAVPLFKICENCGCSDYVTEEIDFPDIVNINYAAFTKTVVKFEEEQGVCAWLENSTGKINFLPLISA